MGDLSPYVPLLSASLCAGLVGLRRGVPLKTMAGQTFLQLKKMQKPIALYLFIGPAISSWIASGTIPTMVLWGSSLISRWTFFPAGLVLMFGTAFMMGSGISALGTMGVALAGIGQAMGFPIWMTAGALASGAFIGNAVSPLASITLLTLAVTECDSREYTRRAMQTALTALLASAAIFTLALFLLPSGATAQTASLEELARHFPPRALCLLPPAVLITLLAFRVSPLKTFFFSILTALAIGLLLGSITPEKILPILIRGYRFEGASPALKAMLDRGGILSTGTIICTILCAMFFGGVYQASGALPSLLESLTRLVRTPAGLKGLGAFSSALLCCSSGSSNLAAMLTGTLFDQSLRASSLDPADFALIEGPFAVCIVTLVPWSANGSSMISILNLPAAGADLSGLLYIPCAIGCYLMPLLLLRKARLRKDAAPSPSHAE